MATLTGKLISNTYKDLLQVSNGNSGIDTTLRPISDGEGTDSALQISNSEVLTTGKLTVQGDVSSSGKITADSAVIASQVCASTYYGDGSNLTGITASAPTSVASFTANQLTVVSGASFQGKVSGTAIEMSGAVCASTYYGDGSNLTGIVTSVPTSVSAYTVNQLTVVSGASFLGKVSGTAAEFSGAVSASTYYGDGSNLTNLPTAPTSVSAFTINQLTLVSGGSFLGKVSGTDLEMSGAVSAANIYATTGIFVGGDAVATSADIQAVSALASANAAAITSINTVVANVSALTSVNAAAITSINSAITSINTVVGNVSVLTSVNAAAITSINTVVANVSVLTSVNAAAITSINSAITSINTVVANVSALTSVNSAAITSVNSAITSINTVVANVSALTSVNAAAITSINSAITSINTVVANVSALTSVNAAAITSINTILEGNVSADSGTFNTLVVKTSASVSGVLKVGGPLGIGISNPSYKLDLSQSGATAAQAMRVADSSPTEYYGIFNANTGGNTPNAANATVKVRGMATTNRSINAGGTVNASGADYAEYMHKADGCGIIAKGDVCGVDADGKLTDQFDNAHSFVVKSTDPSYVGGDVWSKTGQIDDKGREVLLEGDALEAARQNVDRIAFAGQVPCNITGPVAIGYYVVPQRAADGGIKAVCVSNPTLDQYISAVGRVWKMGDTNTHLIAVKIG